MHDSTSRLRILATAKADYDSVALMFLLVMTAVNFRFWDRAPDGTLSRYRHMNKTGARALWASFESAWGRCPDTTEFCSRLKMDGVAGIFGTIPAADIRSEILHHMLQEPRLTTFCSAMAADIRSRHSIQVDHAARIAAEFPLAYEDPYLKKAQLALSMFAGFLRERDLSIDVGDLTAFADYQVPRVMRALGVLRYSPQLDSMILDCEGIQQDSAFERAVRAATILGCEAIAAAAGLSAAGVDNLLWQSQHVAGDEPFHLTVTTRY